MEYAVYLDNLTAERNRLDGFLLKNRKFTRLYFGAEFCEELIPDLAKVRGALKYAQEKMLDYTYLSGPLTDKGISKQHEIFDYLNRQKVNQRRIEVVVNDWGVLALIVEKFKNLDPLLGRLLVRNCRMPRYTIKKPVSYSHLVANPKLHQNQLKILRSTNLTVPEYRKFLKSCRIKRVELDVLPQGIELNRDWGFKFSFYTPWTYITGGRTCDLAGIFDLDKARFITSRTCARACKRFYIKFETGTEMLPLIQRGNSVFFNNSALLGNFIKERVFNRVVLENSFSCRYV